METYRVVWYWNHEGPLLPRESRCAVGEYAPGKTTKVDDIPKMLAIKHARIGSGLSQDDVIIVSQEKL